jgi:hypothetical protein
VVKDLVAQGVERECILAELQSLVEDTLRREGRECDEDLVFDVMDRLTGWCSPGAKI